MPLGSRPVVVLGTHSHVQEVLRTDRQAQPLPLPAFVSLSARAPSWTVTETRAAGKLRRVDGQSSPSLFRLHCVLVTDALARHYLGTVRDSSWWSLRWLSWHSHGYFLLVTECCAHGWFALIGGSTVCYCVCLDTVPLMVVQPLTFLFLISYLEEKHKAPLKSSTRLPVKVETQFMWQTLVSFNRD